MFWRLFKKSVHVKPSGITEVKLPNGDVTTSAKWVVFEAREYAHLWDDRRRYGWRVFLHNVLVTLGVPMRWLAADVEEIED